jgi:hypothetical protein
MRALEEMRVGVEGVRRALAEGAAEDGGPWPCTCCVDALGSSTRATDMEDVD